MSQDNEYVWKVSFRLEDWKLSRKWSKDNLYMFPHATKRKVLSDKHEIRGFYIARTKDDNQEEAVEKAKERIEGVIASLSSMTGTEGLTASYIWPPEVVNEKELRKKGLPVTRKIPHPLVLRVQRPITPQHLDSSFGFLQRVGALPNRDAFRVTMNWFKRGVDYDEPYDRFIALWISFNALYNLYYPKSVDDTDTAKMDNLALNLFSEARAKQLLNSHSKTVSQLITLKGSFLSQSGKTDYAAELEKELLAGNYREALRNAIRCLYGIRKTLFHGARDISESDKKIVEDANPFLKEIVRKSMLTIVK